MTDSAETHLADFMRVVGRWLDRDVAIVALVSEVWMSLTDVLDSHLLMAHLVNRFGTEEQRNTFLPALASGEPRGGLALTEAGCGTRAAPARQANPLVRFTDATVADLPPAARVGEHGREILAEWGFDAAAVDELCRSGVVADPPEHVTSAAGRPPGGHQRTRCTFRLAPMNQRRRVVSCMIS